MDGKELYRWLQSRESQYSIRDLECGMSVYKYVIDGYWRTCYLVNTRTKMAYEIVGPDLRLKSFTVDDIEVGLVQKIEHASNAFRLAAHYPFEIYPFKRGIAYVSWTLYPDGMYFMDEDGFGMEPYEEETIGAYIDTNCKVLVKFQDIEDWHTRDRLYKEALLKAKM